MSNHACDRVLRFGVTIAFLAACVGCSGRSTNPEDNKTEPTIHDPFENEEAELLALVMSGELCAPRDMYEHVHQDLAQIRSEWGETIPQLQTVVHSPQWDPTGILLDVNEATYREIENGQYTAWDSVNALFEVDTITLWQLLHGIAYYAGIGFGGYLNSRLTFDAYVTLPGVIEVSSSTRMGDGPNIYGAVHDWGRAYLFRAAGGDCFSGCIDNRFWYFRSTAEGIEYAGDWYPTEKGQPLPSWWEEASMAVDLYYGWDHHWWWEN